MPKQSKNKSGHRPGAPWLENIQDYYWIHDVLQIYVGLSSWVILWDGAGSMEWMELTPQAPLSLRPTHFEKFYKREGVRVAHHFKCLHQAFEENRMVVGQCWGFHDIFIPIGKAGGKQVCFYADFFLKEPAQWAQLASQWKKLTGKEPIGTDPDFVSYVRMALRLPVLDEVLLKGVKEFLGCYVEFLTGNKGAEPIYQRVDQLRRKVFATRLPNRAWVQEALGFEKLIPPSWAWYPGNQLMPWMKEELGISRIPTTVLAMMPLQPRGSREDPVERLIQNDHIQRECFAYAKKLDQTVAENLQDYGVIFLTSTEPDRSEVQNRLRLGEKAECIREFIKKKFGLKSVIGIGRSVPVGDALADSYQEALLALHLCHQAEKTVLFYGPSFKSGGEKGYVRLHRSAADLLDAYGHVSPEEIGLASERFVREVLEFSLWNVGVVRSQFLSVLFRLLDRVRGRSLLNPAHEASFTREFSRRLDNSDSVHSLIGIFKETLQAISTLAAKPLEGAKNLRMETTLQYIRENYSRSLRLPQVAKEAGFSVPVFCRVFKQATGLSFVAYLNKLRIEQAKGLLRTSGLNVLQIGQSCGFQTSHHFIRNFKQLTGLTPGDFRRKVSVPD